MIYRSYSSADTKKLGERLAKKFSKEKKTRHRALIFALKGDLGSGKTTFTQGFFRGLGIKKRVVSPTFILMRRFKNVYHIDAYRLKKSKELLKLGLKEILENPKNIVLIEWADRVKKILPKGVLWLKFSHGKSEKLRTITSK